MSVYSSMKQKMVFFAFMLWVLVGTTSHVLLWFCFQRNEVHAQARAPRPVFRPHALAGRFTTELSGVVVQLHLGCSGNSSAHLDFM